MNEQFFLTENLPPLEAKDAIMPVMISAFSPEFGEAWNGQQVLAQLLQPNSVSILALTHDNQCLGFVMGRQTLNEMELLLFAVTPEYRSKGIGSALLQNFIDICRERNVEYSFLEMRTNNPAIKIYQSFGFQEVGRRRNYYRGSDGRHYDACTMRLEITQCKKGLY